FDVYRLLPKETKDYLPKFLVIKYLVTYKEYYFENNRNFKYKFSDLKQVKTNKATTITEVSEKTNITKNVVSFMNPHILGNYIPKGSIIHILKK
ncbi:MAG TPA: hypothetical protein DDE71_06435, partial [Tenacibaculum sp.]|nr:hypothetical protein [Tenacibaculum sp.]